MVHLFTYWRRIKLNWRDERFEVIYENIKDALFSRILNAQQLLVVTTKPESEAILQKVSEGVYILPAQLVGIFFQHEILCLRHLSVVLGLD